MNRCACLCTFVSTRHLVWGDRVSTLVHSAALEVEGVYLVVVIPSRSCGLSCDVCVGVF